MGKIVPQGSRNATTDAKKIGQWFGGQLINVAIPTGVGSGIFVLEIGPRHEGDETLDVLETKHGPSPSLERQLQHQAETALQNLITLNRRSRR